MVKKLIGFRVGEEESKEFYKLVEDSGLTVQRVLAAFVGACLEAGTVEAAPISKGKSGRDLSNELKLRETFQTLRGCITAGNYVGAEYRFNDLTDQVQSVRDSTLLEEARVLAVEYLNGSANVM